VAASISCLSGEVFGELFEVRFVRQGGEYE
jgi:hypothetical protein